MNGDALYSTIFKDAANTFHTADKTVHMPDVTASMRVVEVVER